MSTSRARTRLLTRGATAAVAVASLLLAACSSSSSGEGGSNTPSSTGSSSPAGSTGSSGSAGSDSGGAITVWVDAPRVPAVQAFQKAHPEIKVNMVQNDGTVGGQTTKAAFANFDAAGSGWPDAIFFTSNDDIAWAASSQSNYAANLSDIPELADTIKGYDAATISFCNIGGQIRCLRNDAAPDVFWYDAKFFKDNNYTVPKSWDDYFALAIQIAKDHPGKISGFLGDAYAVNRYLQAANCPTNDPKSETEVVINSQDPNCTKMVQLLDQAYQAKALSPLGVFDADAVKASANLVMTPGALWYGSYLLQSTWKVPSGNWTASEPLTWNGKPSMGDEGGGLWGMSSHISGQEKENTITFMKFVATDPAWQVDLSTGLPAYGPDQDAWLAKFGTDGYYSDLDQLKAAFKSSLSAVAPYKYMLYDTGNIWTQTVPTTLTSGGTVTAALSKFFSTLTDQAKSIGYTVSAG